MRLQKKKKNPDRVFINASTWFPCGESSYRYPIKAIDNIKGGYSFWFWKVKPSGSISSGCLNTGSLMEGKRDHPLFKMLQIPHPFSPVLSENPYIQSFDPGTKLTIYKSE